MESSETAEPKITKKRREFKSLFNSAWVVNNIPFFLFISALAVLYIYNGHHADKLIREISKSEKNIRELEYEYKTLKSEVIFRSKASELTKIVEPLGLTEPKQPPVVITVSQQNQE